MMDGEAYAAHRLSDGKPTNNINVMAIQAAKRQTPTTGTYVCTRYHTHQYKTKVGLSVLLRTRTLHSYKNVEEHANKV